MFNINSMFALVIKSWLYIHGFFLLLSSASSLPGLFVISHECKLPKNNFHFHSTTTPSTTAHAYSSQIKGQTLKQEGIRAKYVLKLIISFRVIYCCCFIILIHTSYTRLLRVPPLHAPLQVKLELHIKVIPTSMIASMIWIQSFKSYEERKVSQLGCTIRTYM